MEKLIEKNPGIIGIVLGHHGLFTWANTSELCYKNSIDIIKKAQIYLNDSIKKYSFGKPIYKIKSNSEFETKLISTLRGQLSKENYKIIHIDKSRVTLELVNSQNMKKVSAIGTSCPDHFLRTKRLPLVLPSLSDLMKRENELNKNIEKYLKKYKMVTENIIKETKIKILQI